MNTINWIITDVYVLTPEEQNIVDSNPVTKSKDWENKVFKSLKSRIRKHLYKQQSKRCSFCRLRMNTSQFHDHIEHLVNKARYLNFMFEPKNLTVVCHKCNFDKGTEITLANPLDPLPIYPNHSSDFTIIHPYFDFYLEHIEFVEEVMIVAKNNSPKGLNTIKLYKLDRLNLTEDRAFELKISEQELLKRLVLRLAQENDPAILIRIQNAIDLIPDMVLE